VIFQERLLKVLKCYNFIWVQRRHNCSPAASVANCTTLYLLKVYLQTFLSIPIYQKFQILCCDTLIANERYVPDFLYATTAKVNILIVIWQQKKIEFVSFTLQSLYSRRKNLRLHLASNRSGPRPGPEALKDSKSLCHCWESNQDSLTVQAVAHSP